MNLMRVLKPGGHAALAAAVFVATVGLAPLDAIAQIETLGKVDLLTGDPWAANGDGGSTNHLFLHTGIVVPLPGTLTMLTSREDGDMDSEEFNLMVLRPTGTENEYTIAARQQLFDDLPPADTGITTYALNNLAVQSGDVLAHFWDMQNPGAIPFTNVTNPLEEPGDTTTYWDGTEESAGHAASSGPQSGDLEVGDTFAFVENGGVRDYWFNVTLSTSGFILGDFNNMDGVTVDDFQILADNLYGHLDGITGYEFGDINFDGRQNLDDFHQFQELFPAIVAAASEGVPEPATLGIGLVALAGVLLFCRRRKVL